MELTHPSPGAKPGSRAKRPAQLSIVVQYPSPSSHAQPNYDGIDTWHRVINSWIDQCQIILASTLDINYRYRNLSLSDKHPALLLDLASGRKDCGRVPQLDNLWCYWLIGPMVLQMQRGSKESWVSRVIISYSSPWFGYQIQEEVGVGTQNS